MVYYIAVNNIDAYTSKSLNSIKHAAKHLYRQYAIDVFIECYSGQFHGSGGILRYILKPAPKSCFKS